MILGFIVLSIVTVMFLGIGISCWKSKEAVGFFTGGKPPVMKEENVKKYNHAVAILWFVTAIIFELLGVPLLFMEQNSALVVPVILGTVALSIAMMVAYVRIEAKYRE